MQMADVTYDAGDPAMVNKKKSSNQLKAEGDDHYLHTVLSTYEGRAFIWRTLGLCQVFGSSWTGDERTYFYEGKRSVGLELIELIDKSDIYMIARMRDEAMQRETNG